jgi:G3E family GTPase
LRERLARLAPAAALGEARDLDAAAFLTETLTPPSGLSPRAAHGAAEARVYRSAAPIPAARFQRFLALLGELAGPRLLRVKGLVATDDAPDRPWLVQGAQHAFAPPLRLPAWPGSRENILVVIGEDLSAGTQRLWDALSGAVAPDAADWTALADNPLARRPGGLLG